jgi:hypothetical protein
MNSKHVMFITFELLNHLAISVLLGYINHHRVTSQIFDLNWTEEWLDNRKRWMIQKSDEPDEGKYRPSLQLSLRYY